MNLSPSDVDTVLIRALSADFDERGDDDTVGNDIDLAIEEMTDDERRIRRVNNLRRTMDLILRAMNVAILTRDVTAGGGFLAASAQQLGVDALRDALKKIDRIMELEGE